MKRQGGLWPLTVSWANLCRAVHRAALGKRSRPDVAAFLLEWEPHLVRLQRELQNRKYTPAGYRTFIVHEPKRRQISAAPFRDRVVHHALTQILEPVFEPRFAAQSYACRTGFGTHKAIEAAAEACRSFPYALKADIRKYFPSIDHAILKTQLSRVVKCPDTLDLAGRIIDGSNFQEPVDAWFPGDDLFSPFERRRGLPLGNQTSQFFANVYLNEARRAAEERLEALRLRVHEGKTRVYRAVDGITFLGWRIFPGKRRLVRSNVVRFRRRIVALQRRFERGDMDWAEAQTHLQAWNAHAAHGDTWMLRDQVFSDYPFIRGERG